VPNGAAALCEEFPEFPVALEMPLAAHRLPPGAEYFRVQQHPGAAARGARAGAAVVLGETALDVGGPADIGQDAVRRAAAEDIDEAWHGAIMRDSRECVANEFPDAFDFGLRHYDARV
jgi:hypothetical protein